MKKKILFLCVSALMISLVSCKKAETSSSVSSFSGSSSPTTSINSGENNSTSQDSIVQNTLIPDTLRLHFKTETKDLTTLAFWFWSDTYKPEVETSPTGTDDFGIYVDIDTPPFLRS